MINDNPTVAKLLKKTPAVVQSEPCFKVLEIFLGNSNLFAIPVVSNQNKPLGLVERGFFIDKFIKPYAKEIYGKKKIIEFTNTSSIIVDQSISIDEVAKVVLNAGMEHMVSGFIATDKGLYIGIANGHDLLSEITERKQAHLYYLAHFDHLTKLPNRVLLQDRLVQAMTSSKLSGHYGALLFIDLDNFKLINDTLGHHIGDLLLINVAQRLNLCITEEDTVARLGGDEFIVLLTRLGKSESEAAGRVEAVGNNILTTLNQAYQLEDSVFHNTPSIGATLFTSHEAEVDTLMKQADIAMYKSKESGRNTLHFFDQAMENALINQASLESDLRKAIQEQQLLLHYQAQVVEGGLMTGAEVLVRWQHPQRGMVSPAEFIPLAEETGMILPLGRWILHAACIQLSKWADNPEMAHLTLSVNISAHQLNQDDFVEQVLEAVNISGANPNRLKLELTESMLVININGIIQKMNVLISKGIGFSLDDFGTGFSSLSFLKYLPLAQLKIDQSFVRNIHTDQKDASIAKTIVALAKNLRMDVIAEGVETAGQRDFLVDIGCHAYQGYFFSRPLSLQDFENFAKSVVQHI